MPNKVGPVTTKLATSAYPAAKSQKTSSNAKPIRAPSKHVEELRGPAWRVPTTQPGTISENFVSQNKVSQNFVDAAWAEKQKQEARGELPQHILDNAWRSFMKSVGGTSSGLVDPSKRQKPSTLRIDTSVSAGRQVKSPSLSTPGPSGPASSTFSRRDSARESPYTANSSRVRDSRSSTPRARQYSPVRSPSYSTTRRDSTIRNSPEYDEESPVASFNPLTSLGRSISNAFGFTAPTRNSVRLSRFGTKA